MTVDENRPALLFAIALALGIAFRPVMRMARRVADRLVYGKRATPYEVLTEFSERVGDVLRDRGRPATDGAGPRRGRRGARWRASGSGSAASSDPRPPGRPTRRPRRRSTAPTGAFEVPGETAVEVRDRGELLGALSVRMPASDPMNPAKEKLVRDLAAQAGLVLRNVRLVEDLRASRQRLVAAQDEERRRLERNIHDGAQQQLVALAVKARLAGQFDGAGSREGRRAARRRSRPRPRRRSRTSATSRAASTRRCSPIAGSWPRSRRSRARASSGVEVDADGPSGGSPPTWRPPSTSAPSRRSRTSRSTPPRIAP